MEQSSFQDEQTVSECIPFAFRVYATYEVNSRLSDLKLHAIIDKLNPDLRSVDEFNGQKRVREFYAMKPEEAYAILEAMAEIHDCKENLKLVVPSDVEAQEEQLAQEIDTESHEKAENFSFVKCQIYVGESSHKANYQKIDIKNKSAMKYNKSTLLP